MFTPEIFFFISRTLRTSPNFTHPNRIGTIMVGFPLLKLWRKSEHNVEPSIICRNNVSNGYINSVNFAPNHFYSFLAQLSTVQICSVRKNSSILVRMCHAFCEMFGFLGTLVYTAWKNTVPIPALVPLPPLMPIPVIFEIKFVFFSSNNFYFSFILTRT